VLFNIPAYTAHK